MKETTAARLNQIMAEQGLKQVEILEKSKEFQNKYDIKLGKSALSQYVSGKSNPDQDKIFLLSKVLDVDEAWLLGFDVPRKTTMIVQEDNATYTTNGNSGINNMSGDMNGNITINNNSSNPVPVAIKNTDDIFDAQGEALGVQEDIMAIQKEILETNKQILVELKKLNKKIK